MAKFQGMGWGRPLPLGLTGFGVGGDCAQVLVFGMVLLCVGCSCRSYGKCGAWWRLAAWMGAGDVLAIEM